MYTTFRKKRQNKQNRTLWQLHVKKCLFKLMVHIFLRKGIKEKNRQKLWGNFLLSKHKKSGCVSCIDKTSCHVEINRKVWSMHGCRLPLVAPAKDTGLLLIHYTRLVLSKILLFCRTIIQQQNRTWGELVMISKVTSINWILDFCHFTLTVVVPTCLTLFWLYGT